MKKRLFIAALALCFVFATAFCVNAAEEEYSLELLVNGKQNDTVSMGDTMIVTLRLQNNAAESYDLFSMQDYVCFDPDYLEFVEDSIAVYTMENGAAICSASVLKFSGDRNDRVYVSRTSMTSAIMHSDAVLLSFQLRAIRSGNVELVHKKPEIFEIPGHQSGIAVLPASVTIQSTMSEEQWEFISAEKYGALQDGAKVAILKTDRLINGTYSIDGKDLLWSSAYGGYACIVADEETAASLNAKLTLSPHDTAGIRYSGDVDGDGRVKGADVIAASAALHQLDAEYTIDERMRLEMDVNGDKQVTAQDVTYMLRIIVGLNATG